ncbi:hypothetical protein ACIHCQ_32710 [Streptomyces sp. NPDC052236]|uniref:hypothetical protein n=1 Tax=Streptomyces sp. NPDC052236 TaxID=3365686 RepID=UPI0037D70A5B
MRGLTDRSGGRKRAASGAATAALAALGVFAAAACSAGGSGVQDEGAALGDSKAAKAVPSAVPSSTAAGRGTRTVDVVRLLQEDPKVSKQVKADLKPCDRDTYPVDTSYGYLTGAAWPDVVVNVMTCDDALGMGTYVYRPSGESGEKYVNVFMVEEPAVYSAIDRGDLVVTKEVYTKGDALTEPSGEELTTYHWTSGKFTQQHWVRNEFSGAVGEGLAVAPEPTEPADLTELGPEPEPPVTEKPEN